MSANTTKLLLDTDIGSDIDDALCLAYLLAEPRCNLLGITTVTGEPALRAAIASAQCKHAGKDIPIHSGAADPLLIAQQQPKAPQAAALGRWPHATDFPPNQAVDFLRRTIRANPGEITLLAIGPLTNIALLFALDPEIPSLLKELVLMCGAFTDNIPAAWWNSVDGAIAEWNAKLDGHATAMVYRAPVKRKSIGLDVTLQVSLTADEVRARFQGVPQLAPVLDFAEVWFQHAPVLYFHDPLAAMTIFEPALCTFEPGRVDIDLSATSQFGVTHFTADPAGADLVALKVDSALCIQKYFERFAA